MGRTLTYSQPTRAFRSTVTFQQRQIMKAISALKNGKATGPDEITTEAIKANIETSVSILYKLIKKIWEEESFPEEWKQGILMRLTKKGDLSEYSKYQGILLLSVPNKILNRILLDRIEQSSRPKTL